MSCGVEQLKAWAAEGVDALARAAVDDGVDGEGEADSGGALGAGVDRAGGPVE